MSLINFLCGSIAGFFSNRIRGNDNDIWFMNQDDANAAFFAIVFTLIFQLPLYSLLVLYIVMRLGGSTGWTEFVMGCEGRYEKDEGEIDKSWISNDQYLFNFKIWKGIKIVDQKSCFLWGCVRSAQWCLCLFIGLLTLKVVAFGLLLPIPLFYVCYRGAHLFDKRFMNGSGDIFGLAEPVFGFVLWGACSLAF